MPYEIPTKFFDAAAHATNIVRRANQFQESIVTQFQESYRNFWGVTDPPTGLKYSVEEMQAVIDLMPMTVIDILSDAAKLVNFIEAAYPGTIEERYKTAAFEYTIDQGGIKLTKVADAWTPPLVDTEV